MAAIYCKLSYPPFVQSGMELSPSSSLSSSSIFSPRDAVGDGWSPRWKRQSVCEPLKNPFKIKGEAVNAGPYNSMVEVPWICADKDQLADATCMLRTFRSIVGHLESIDPSQMQRDSKLAFWINVYNALVMHAYLAYGIPRSNLRRMLLFQRLEIFKQGYILRGNKKHCEWGEVWNFSSLTKDPSVQLPSLLLKLRNYFLSYILEHCKIGNGHVWVVDPSRSAILVMVDQHGSTITKVIGPPTWRWWTNMGPPL
eukprot:Gb_33724 [translate_table: standard]